jgi:tape measure domain-containing protein
MAGQNADMTLKVGLDLNFFRQELQKASSSLAGQPIDINVRFNKKGIADQYRLLTRYLGGKKSFDVKIESNTLNALTDKVANFQKTLKALKDEKVELSINASANIEKFSKEKIRKIRAQIRRDIVSGGAGEIQLPTRLATPNVTAFVRALAKQAQVTVAIKNGATGKEARNVLDAIEDRIQSDQKIKQGGGKLRVPTSIKASINNADVSDFKKAVNEKLGSIAIKIKAEVDIAKTPAQIQAEVARKMEDIARIGAERMAGGGVTEAARREQFRAAITGEGIGSLKNIAGQVGVKGAYKYKSETAAALIDKLVQEASIEAITKYLDPQAVMRNPDRSGLNRVLDTFARGLLQMLGMDPAALKAAKVQTIQSAAQTMQVARSSSGGLPAGVAGLLPSVTQRTAISQGVQGIYRGLGGQIGEEGPGGALVDVRRIYAALERNLRKIFEVVEVDVQETSMGIRDAMGAFAYLAQALQDAEARTKKAQVGNAVKSLLEKVTGALKAAEAQAVIPVSVRDVTLRPQEPQFRPGSRVPLTMAPQRTLPAVGETTANINRMRIRTGYNVPAPIEANPFYAAPSVPRSRAPYTGAVKTATPRRTPGGFIGVGEAAGGGLEEAAFVNAAKNALRFNEALNISRKSLDGFRASQLPLVGGLRELGSEFGFALKQVLLFGTAYKGLAFVQSLPGQILNAAKSQQQYNNALQTATQDTGTFAKELLYVDNVQRAFGLNLQTTRDGFTKLYASMAPADFDSGSIEKLFTGISAATAALQLTPDKAERVIYAFGQMASKGQIMSEELKGQLGDVLPGALAIFAKAAGMSVKEFSKAMEDGEFVGQKFRDTFAKVSDELMTRFGTGAQAAGKSLQGLLNTVQGDFARTLESFAPLADAAAQAILGPLGGSLKQLSQSAKIATGEIERTYSQLRAAQQDVSDLRAGGADAKDIKAAEQNVAALTARYTALMRAAQDPAIAKQAQDIQKFTEELTKAGTFVMNMAKAIGSVLSPVLNLLGGNLTTVISLLTSFYVGFQAARLAAMALMGALSLYKGLTALLGLGTAATQATALAGAFNVLGVAATGTQVKVVGLRVALTALVATTVIGAVVGGITLIAGAFATMRDRAKEAADESRNAVAEGARAATMGEVMTVTTQLNQELAKNRAVSEGYKTLEKIYLMNKEIMKQGGRPLISVKDMATLKEAEKYSREIAGIISGNQMKRGRFEIQAFRGQELGRAKQEAGQVSAEVRKSTTILKQQEQDALRRQKQIGLNQPTPSTIVEAEPPDEQAAKKALNDAEQLAKQEQQRRIELANFANDMHKIEFDRDVQLSDAAFEHKKSLIDTLNEYELSGLNDIQARQVKFAQDLKKIQLNAVDAVRKALQKSQEAQLNVVAAQRTAQATGGGGGPSVAGFTPAELSTATAAASKFTGIANMCSESVKAFYKSLGISLPGVTAWADTVRNAGTTMRDWSKLAPGDIVATGRPGDTPHVGVYTGGQNVFHQSRSRGLKAGNYPDLDYFKQGGYFVRPNGGMKQSSASFSMDTKVQKESFDLQKQLAQSTNQIALQSLEIERAIQLAKEQTAATIKANIDNIFPVEKQKLDLQLQQMRNNLILQGMPQEYIDYEEQRALKAEEAAAASSKMKDAINEAKVELGKYNAEAAKGIDLAPEQKARMKILEDQIAANEEGLKKLTDAQRQSNIASLENAIATMKQADALKALEETSGRINQAVEGVTGTYKDMFKEIAKGGDSVDALKKAQEALADQALTMFFDFAMQPVEKFFKDQLGAVFGVPDEDAKRQEQLTAMEKQLAELKAARETQQRIDKNVEKVANGGGPGAQQGTSAPGIGGIMAPGGIGDYAAGAVTQLPEALGSLTESANAYSEELGKVDASVWGSAMSLGQAGEQMGPNGAAGKTWQQSLGSVVSGIGMAAGSIMGIMAGINQVKEGGTSNVLGGIGSIMTSVGGLLGGFSGMFGGGGAGQFGTSSSFNGTADALGAAPFAPKIGAVFANGGIARGGFRAFANGGVVNGPTLGLMGEGRYNEAIVPLPDGKSIPVQMRGQSSRDLLAGNARQQSSSPVLSMSFQTTKFGDREYVDVAQLQAAMAETRKMAARDGANRGASLALDKLQNSPSARRKVGMR